ncbi:uncharacterized protein LOC124343807 isoform X2 [Daphnia pulicaria]|uniref:uncharacterized protein LOC124343807 isoform X2 n=1 Tax=Daphnia pulicaria TaxID=35523 RepID=UPI001EEC39E7|nr:uncharacterized protein LOC124343807 isoform X2 [Daphnia pulicaria]
MLKGITDWNKPKMTSAVEYHVCCLLVVLSLSAFLCHAKEPECPFGSPKIDLADLDGRCDRFWMCEDGLISDIFCPSGNGFNPASQKCDTNAPCLTDSSSVTTERPAGLSRIVDILIEARTNRPK